MDKTKMLAEVYEMVREAYRAGFIDACEWPSPVTQDADSTAFDHGFIKWNNEVRTHDAEIEAMAEQFGALRYLAASMYQAAGAYSLPVRFLDVLSAAGNGDPITWNQVAALLPCETPMFDELDNAIDAAMLDNKQETI